MCLTIVTSGPAPEAQGVGYKVFCIHKGNLWGVIAKNDPLNEGEWIVDKKRGNLYAASFTQMSFLIYKTGFHLFQNRKDAETYLESFKSWLTLIGCQDTAVLRKVRYRNVRAKGKQEVDFLKDGSLRPCIVAKEMFIEPEEEKQCA
jgi:hypothetical protein